jgi:hypothetical protein
LSLSIALIEPQYGSYWASVLILLSLSIALIEPQYWSYWASVWILLSLSIALIEPQYWFYDPTPTSSCFCQDAIEMVDLSSRSYPAYYMINCAHPLHFQKLFQEGECSQSPFFRTSNVCTLVYYMQPPSQSWNQVLITKKTFVVGMYVHR